MRGGEQLLADKYKLYIDGQNVPPRYIDQIQAYCRTLGKPARERKFYASVEQVQTILTKTRTLLAENDIDPVSVPCRKGKNSVDIFMAVDIIEDALGEHGEDIVVLVTNDSDFTHIASRLISRGNDLHLLYSTTKPDGYSKKVIFHRLQGKDGPAKSLAAGAKKLVQQIVSPKAARVPASAAAPAKPPPIPYSRSAPLKALDETGFFTRLFEYSPIMMETQVLFRAWQDFSGKRWKPAASKSTAADFLAEHIGPGRYTFVQWEGMSPNSGYIVRSDLKDALVMTRGVPVLALLGASRYPLHAQCHAIARRMASGPFPSLDAFHDADAETTLAPRYVTWALVRNWLSRTGIAAEALGQSRAIAQDPSVTAELLMERLYAALAEAAASGALTLSGMDTHAEARPAFPGTPGMAGEPQAPADGDSPSADGRWSAGSGP